MRRRGIVVAAIVLACGANAQRQQAERLRALATGGATAVEAARRELAAVAAEELPAAELVQLLRSAEPLRRTAAAWLLLHHGLGGEQLVDALRSERDVGVLELLVDALPLDLLPRLVLDDELSVPDEDAVLDPVRLRVRALGRLVDADRVDEDLWRSALGSGDPRFAQGAARLLVTESPRLPPSILDDPGLRALLLDALADRPRCDALTSLAAWRAAPDLALRERLLLTLATPPSQYERAAIRELFDGLASQEREPRLLALRICARLSSEQADQLVAELHRRGLAGGSLDDLLQALDAVSTRGERHLAGIARALDETRRSEIVEWLAARNSALVDELVAEALDAPDSLAPSLLRRAGPQLVTPERVELVRGILADPERELALRRAAFDALVDAGRSVPELLSFALAPDGDPRSRVRRMLAMPPQAIDAAIWRRLLREAPEQVVDEVLAAGVAAPPDAGIDALLFELATSDDPFAHAAARAVLQSGREPLARRLWESLDEERRALLAGSLRARPRSGDWLVPALRALAAGQGSPELTFTRLAAGDQTAVRELLAAVDDFDLGWLRRCREPLSAALSPADLPTVTGAFARAEPARRRELVRWIAARPDLGADDWLAELAADDPDDEVRLEATQGLLRRPGPAARLRARVAAAIPGGLDEELRELAFDVLGAMTPPLDAGEAELVARLVLVAPLTRPEHELAIALRQEPIADLAVFSLLWQLLRQVPSPAIGPALASAADEAGAHPNVAYASRHRLGRLLELLAREDRLRAVAAPVARAIVATPDLDAMMLGPAEMILAEDAERRGDHAAAAAHWRAAARGLLRMPPEPVFRRTFVGDTWLAQGRLPAAFLAARPHVCDARAALAAGDHERARSALAKARILGALDQATEQAIDRIESELR